MHYIYHTTTQNLVALKLKGTVFMINRQKSIIPSIYDFSLEKFSKDQLMFFTISIM